MHRFVQAENHLAADRKLKGVLVVNGLMGQREPCSPAAQRRSGRRAGLDGLAEEVRDCVRSSAPSLRPIRRRHGCLVPLRRQSLTTARKQSPPTHELHLRIVVLFVFFFCRRVSLERWRAKSPSWEVGVRGVHSRPWHAPFPSRAVPRTGEAIIAVFFKVLATLHAMDFIARTVMGTLTGPNGPGMIAEGKLALRGGGIPPAFPTRRARHVGLELFSA